jgi:hypothetical protein
MFDNLFKGFNKVGKSLPNSKEVFKIPSQVKNDTLNISLNKIDVTYWNREGTEKIETIGDIRRFQSTSLVTFEVPNCKGAILLLNGTTFINRTKNNNIGIEVCENYPFSLDRNSDLLRFSDVDYQDIRDDIRTKTLSTSQNLYYKDYKLFIPRMMGEVPIPIIRLDNAERLQKVDSNYVKQLSNISQTFLREWIDIELLKRTGNNKTVAGAIYIAILFFVIGSFSGLIISALTR